MKPARDEYQSFCPACNTTHINWRPTYEDPRYPPVGKVRPDRRLPIALWLMFEAARPAKGHYGIRPGAVQSRSLQTPKRLLPRPSATSDRRCERDYRPLQGQIRATSPRSEDLYRYLPGKGRLEGLGSGDQRNCPGTPNGPSSHRRDIN